MFYESTRNKNIKLDSSNAILQGLSEEGGLFVYRELGDKKLDLNLLNDNYFDVGKEVIKIFLPNFSDADIEECLNRAYKDKFSTKDIVKISKLKDSYIMELFNGPTSAFKDYGLLLLSQFTRLSLEKSGEKSDILILTATSGDTGKAALEGFKDVDRIKIMVFYPNSGVSKIQELQMKTQEGENVNVCAINGNFDDAQTAIKKIFTNENIKKELSKFNLKLSSANSINIGRLIPQVIYYVYTYMKLVNNNEIKLNEKVNFVVPTGNFGNILAGYLAKEIGLPINKLVCASNENNVLYDFIKTGIYDKNREFKKTISPSMDILVSSNLERLLYYISDKNNEYINKLMKNLNETGKFELDKNLLEKIQEIFIAGYATDEDTRKIINKVYEEENYLLDTHTAVAYKVLLDNIDNNHKSIVLQTASPYKFALDVYTSIFDDNTIDEIEVLDKLYNKTHINIPENLKDLDKKSIRFDTVIEKDDIEKYVINTINKLS